jgi:predicted Ser/Thr protein kinase
MPQDEELKKRVEALERENRELKKAAGRGTPPKTIRYSIGDFKGHPTITFEIGGRHLTLGLRKAAVVLRCIEHIRTFVADNNGEISDWDVVQGADGEKSSGGDDLQI